MREGGGRTLGYFDPLDTFLMPPRPLDDVDGRDPDTPDACTKAAGEERGEGEEEEEEEEKEEKEEEGEEREDFSSSACVSLSPPRLPPIIRRAGRIGFVGCGGFSFSPPPE